MVKKAPSKFGYNESMKRFNLFFLSVWLAGLVFISLPPAFAQTQENVVLIMTIDDTITPASALYLERAIQTAEDRQATALILQLDTPGGDLGATFDMAEAMRNSSVPVIVYVAPRGAMAGSAGLLIALAAHGNYMAPETAIGAASPVGTQGEDLNKTMKSKVANITKASIRSWASWRGEAAIDLAEAAIDEAHAVSAEEALHANLTDGIVDSLSDLLAALDGRTAHMKLGDLTLHTAHALTEPLQIRLIEKLLGVLVNPNIVFILLTIGVQAILIELSAPGGWAAGTVGVISLALAAYGLGVLPVNWAGLVIMAVSFVLFVLDVKAATHGALTTAGIITFIIGALILFNSARTPAYQHVSVPLVVAVGILIGASFGVIVGFAVKMLKESGYDSLTLQTGGIGRAVTALEPVGQVRYQGQIWTAEARQLDDKIAAGETVRVLRREGLRLIVQREAEPTVPPRREA